MRQNFSRGVQGQGASPAKDRDADVRLLERLIAREGEAMADLYDRYGRVTYSIVCRIVGDEGVAEDLVQEIFFRIWSHPNLYEQNKGTLFGWITAIARNRAIDYLRSTEGRISQRRTDLISLRYTRKTEASDFQFSSSVTKALEDLSPNQREVIRLAYFEGMSQSEMATQMKQPLGTVKSWVRTAMANLRREVADFQSATAA